jgi:transposase
MGVGHVRSLMVQLSWLWLYHQPESQLSQWYRERFAGGGSRVRRVGIVALARRLAIAFWRFVEFGVIPEGARLRG